MTRWIWTDERIAWLREYAPGHSINEIADEFERRWGWRPSVSSLKNAKVEFNARSRTNGGRFKKGCAGGFTSDEHKQAFLEAGRATRFKKGQMPHNGHKPVGSERVDSYGYTWVKVAMRKKNPGSAHDNWIEKHRLVYEQHYGPVPPDHCILFADHDRSNFDPENLVAVPNRLKATIARMGVEYSDRETLEAVMALAELTQARARAERHPRRCASCGATFEPRFPKQRRCDACLDAAVAS